jgi:hypothetical protein
VNPAAFSFFAAARPEIPAPMIIIFLSLIIGVSVSRREQALDKEDGNIKSGLALRADKTNLRRNIEYLDCAMKLVIFKNIILKVISI